MKILIAADGNTMESLVARRFERGVWYLIVDEATLEIEQHRNLTPQDHNRIFERADAIRVGAVIADKIGTGPCRHILKLGMDLAHARNMTVRQALLRMKEGELEFAGRESLQAMVDRHEILRGGEEVKFGRSQKRYTSPVDIDPGTPRGHHHVQQYAGRGH